MMFSLTKTHAHYTEREIYIGAITHTLTQAKTSATLYSCNMGMSALPEICDQSLKVQLKDVDIHFRQITSTHATTNM